MSNPATKSNLESTHFRSFSKATQARLLQCLRNDAANIRPFSAPGEAIEAIKQGLNRVQPRNPGMPLIVGSQTNAFDQAMINTVRDYKLRKNIIRAGKQLDNVVGRGTLAQLDNDLKAFGALPPVAVLGSTQWRFTFVGDSSAFLGKGKFFLDIASTQRNDGLQFALIEKSSTNQMAGGFRGSCTGAFVTERATFAAKFGSANCTLNVVRANGALIGSILLDIGRDGNGPISIRLPRFRDETENDLGGSLTVQGALSEGR